MDIILPYIMQCNRCEKEISSKQRKDYHCNNVICGAKHLGRIRTNFICKRCPKMFTSNQSLQYHQNNLVCIKKNKSCNFCLKTLSSARRFRQHSDKCKTKQEEIDKFREYNPKITEDTVSLLLKERRELRWQMKEFDKEESWYDQKYWMGTCDRCGCIRKAAGHYASCHSLI